MKQEITALQKRMIETGTDVYFIPSADDHNSEYFADYFKCCEFLSGFRSESAEIIVTQEGAWLWTDGRYFIQAERELAGSGITLMRMGQPEVPSVLTFLTDLVYELNYNPLEDKKGYTLAFDGRLVPDARRSTFEEELAPLGVTLRTDLDLVGDIWENRPSIPVSRIRRLPLFSSGITSTEKTAELIRAMSRQGATHLLISDLSEIAWLTNLRGSDIDYTPVFYSYMLISWDLAELFVKEGACRKDAKGQNILPTDYVNGWWPQRKDWTLTPGTGFSTVDLEKAAVKANSGDEKQPKGDPEDLSFITLRPYDEITQVISALPAGSTLWYDPETTSALLADQIPEGVTAIKQPTPLALRKVIRSRGEIKSTTEAHIRDGRAMVEFLYWLRQNRSGGNGPITEMDAAKKIDEIRLAQPGCFDLSFPTISGYGPNGAVIHYAVSPETNLEIQPEGFLLVDSGGQYLQGTTDITRTFAMGPLTQKMKEYYTYVLKSHIALSSAIITPETTGSGLDTLARRPLRDHDLDFQHGISHGVGHVLSVHEGPNGIRRSARECTIGPGMIQSCEPGIYVEGEFGIRIENEIICTENEDGNYYFIPITYCPYEREAILPELLTKDELDWVNSYHDAVYEILAPRLRKELREFLKEETMPIRL